MTLVVVNAQFVALYLQHCLLVQLKNKSFENAILNGKVFGEKSAIK